MWYETEDLQRVGEVVTIRSQTKEGAVEQFVKNNPSDARYIKVGSFLGPEEPFDNPNSSHLAETEEDEEAKRQPKGAGEGVNLTAQSSTSIGQVIEASTQQRSLPYEPPLLAVLYKILGWIILAGGILSLLSGFPKGFTSGVTFIIASLFIFGIAQVVDLIGMIEFNTRKPQK